MSPQAWPQRLRAPPIPPLPPPGAPDTGLDDRDIDHSGSSGFLEGGLHHGSLRPMGFPQHPGTSCLADAAPVVQKKGICTNMIRRLRNKITSSVPEERQYGV
ncbi:hypothetical protein NQZ68_011400 [Dissostichus eleginoides]|nr:hypothetical protein NQZ68_011400 [Dissostichus eleginoides]